MWNPRLCPRLNQAPLRWILTSLFRRAARHLLNPPSSPTAVHTEIYIYLSIYIVRSRSAEFCAINKTPQPTRALTQRYTHTLDSEGGSSTSSLHITISPPLRWRLDYTPPRFGVCIYTYTPRKKKIKIRTNISRGTTVHSDDDDDSFIYIFIGNVQTSFRKRLRCQSMIWWFHLAQLWGLLRAGEDLQIEDPRWSSSGRPLFASIEQSWPDV